MKITSLSPLPVAVIGAGPVGLAAAAELVGRRIPVIVLEAGTTIGAHIHEWAHVRVFSPWRYNVARPARLLLEETGWQVPHAEALPTGAEIVSDYLEPLAAHPEIRSVLSLETRVRAVSRMGTDKLRDADRADRPFLLRVIRHGREEDILAQAVIDCSGTLSSPNHAGAHGIPARGERENRKRITYGMPDVLNAARARYAGRRVAVLGSGHSAIGIILDLLTLKKTVPKTEIIWLSRRKDLRLAYGGGAADALPARGALGSGVKQAVDLGEISAVHPFALDEILGEGEGLRLRGVDGEIVHAEELVVATGFRPDLAMLGEIRLDLDPALECPRALAPLIDPNVHSCGTVRPHGAMELGQPEQGFYLAGMKSYGRAPTFLLATGYEQVRSIVAELAGDHAAAMRVELELPETGICSSDILVETGADAAGCCGGPPKADASACCARDEDAKAAGASGCGCGVSASIPVEAGKPAEARKPASACC